MWSQILINRAANISPTLKQIQKYYKDLYKIVKGFGLLVVHLLLM